MMNRQELLKKANALPQSPGVYIMHDADGNIIYIGKAKILPNRVTSYFRNTEHDLKTTRMIENVADFEVILTSTELEALLTECSLIRKHAPKYNIALKNERGYQFIRYYENDGFPILKFERYQSSKGRYMGPFISTYAARIIMEHIRRVFALPSCKGRARRKKVCLEYDIGRCLGFCQKGLVSPERLQEVSRGVADVFSGNLKVIVDDIESKMHKAADELRFEDAALLRDKLRMLQTVSEKMDTKVVQQRHADYIAWCGTEQITSIFLLCIRNGYIVGERSDIFDEPFSDGLLREYLERYYSQDRALPKHIYIDRMYDWTELLNEWLNGRICVPVFSQDKDLLGLAERNASERLLQRQGRTRANQRNLHAFCEFTGITRADRMEIYDVSHLAGSDVVCGMVVCVDGAMVSDQYRKFRIGKFDGRDDTAYMSEAVARRLGRFADGDEKFAPLPDVIICDGGLAQIHSVEKVVESFGYDIRVIGFKKDSRHRTKSVVFGDGRELKLNVNPQVHAFCGRLQEKVHRYAVSYHKSLRDVTAPQSELLSINGMGKVKLKALFDRFGTLEKMREASVEQLAAVKGITPELAGRIKDTLSGGF